MVQRFTNGASKVALLQQSPLFFDLHSDELTLIADLCQEVTCGPGETIVVQGAAGDSMFIILEGNVQVLQMHLDGVNTPWVVTTLGPGEFFGEMSMLEKGARSATVRTTTDTRLLVLTTEDFYSFAKIFRNGFTVIVINIARILSQRLRTTTETAHLLSRRLSSLEAPPVA